MRFVLLFTFILNSLFLVSCAGRENRSGGDSPAVAASPVLVSPFPVLTAAEDAAVRERISRMNMKERAAQLLFVGIGGSTLSRYTADFLSDVRPGGILLFRGNVSNDARKTIDFIDSLYGCYTDTSGGAGGIDEAAYPFIGIDLEGGLVNRLTPLGTELPSASDIAHTLSPGEAAQLYDAAARQLAMLGITVNFAPVAESYTAENRAVLDTRCFSDDPELSALYAASFSAAMRRAGVLAVAKHFPGNASDDPHAGLPVLDVPYDTLMASYITPFAAALAAAPGAVLMSHVVVPSIENALPACLSPRMIRDILREGLGYRGLVISDDVRMAALEQNGYDAAHAAEAAVRAGVTMVMISGGDIERTAEHLASVAESDLAFARAFDDAVYLVLSAKLNCRSALTFPDMTPDERASEFVRARDEGNAAARAVMEAL